MKGVQMKSNQCMPELFLTGVKDRCRVNHSEPDITPPTMTTDRIRTTVSIPADAYDVFVIMAKTQRVSIGRCIGDWLADTAEGAQFVTHKMAQMRRAPTESMKELHDTIVAEIEQFPAKVPKSPRPSNTGGKSPSPVAAKKAKP